MLTNRRKGFRRLAVAVGGPWFSFWALVGWAGYYGYDKAQNAMSEDLRAREYSMMTHWSEQSATGLSWMKNALLWGVAVPMLLLFAGTLVFWVYRGFKPKVVDEPNPKN